MITRPPLILIVDDAPINITLLESLLKPVGYTVLTATNGLEARTIAIEAKPDLILLDVMMPEEGGFEACKKLKADPETTDIPIIFISAATDVQTKVEGLSIGGLDYITKPFQPHEILARVKNYLKLHFAYNQVIEEQAKRLKQVTDAQQTILVKPKDEPGARFAVHYVPIQEAGGDFYDVFQFSPNCYGYFVSDISGHDLGASFATSALKALVQVNSSSLYEPDETIRLINRVLTNIFTDGQHLTAIYCHYDRVQHKLIVTNAAHLPLIIVSRDGTVKQIQADGDIIGVFRAGLFQSQVVQLNKGDRFFLFTDGLVECSQPYRSRQEGIEEFIKDALLTIDMPLEKAIHVLVSQMLPSSRQPEDDVLLLGVEA